MRRATFDLPHDFARGLQEGLQPPTSPVLSTGRSSYQQHNSVEQVGTQRFYGIKFIAQPPASHVCLHCFKLAPWSHHITCAVACCWRCAVQDSKFPFHIPGGVSAHAIHHLTCAVTDCIGPAHSCASPQVPALLTIPSESSTA